MRPASVSVNGVGVSPWLPIDPSTDGYIDGIYIEPGAGATISVEVTCDKIMEAGTTIVAFPIGVAALTGATANAAAGLPFAATAVRLNQTVGGSTSVLTFIQRGIR